MSGLGGGWKLGWVRVDGGSGLGRPSELRDDQGLRCSGVGSGKGLDDSGVGGGKGLDGSGVGGGRGLGGSCVCGGLELGWFVWSIGVGPLPVATAEPPPICRPHRSENTLALASDSAFARAARTE